MKLFYFMIIAIGIMFTFQIAGINTGSNLLLDKFIGGTTTNIDPTVSGTSPSDIAGASNFWIMLNILFAVAIALSIVGAVLGGQRSESAINALVAGAATFIWSMFAIDFWSILKLMSSVTGGSGWEYWLVWIIIVPFEVGFGYSLINFIQGTE